MLETTQAIKRESGSSLLRRKLGAIETAMALSLGLTQGTTQGALVISLTGVMTQNALRDAAELVFYKYALLRCRIQIEADDLYFIEHNDFERIAVDFVPMVNFDDWENQEIEELHDTLDQTKALWRLRLFSTAGGEHKIVLVVHHGIVDADGAKALVRDLLSFTDILLRGKQVAFEAGGLPPSVDDILPVYVDRGADEVVRCDPIPYQTSVAIEVRRTRFLRTKLKILDYSVLGNNCRRDRISIDAAYAAALSFAAISSGLAHPPLAFKTAVSLREYAATKRQFTNELGCYIAVADTALEVKNPNFLATAQEYHKKLMAHTINHSLKKKNTSTAAMRRSIESAKSEQSFNGFGITNIGEMNPTAAFERFSIEDIYNLTNRVAGNHAFVLQVSTFRGEPRFIFTYVDQLLRKEVLEKICDDFKRHLADYYWGSV